MRNVVIVAAARTAVGSFNGGLSSIHAVELGRIVIEAVIQRSGIDKAEVDEVILGQVLQDGCGQNPARQAAMNAGLPDSVPSYTVNKLCGSGLKSVALGALSIAAGEAEVIVAGGMESMSQAPYLLYQARSGYRLGDGALVDAVIKDGLTDAFNDIHMGVTAENIASRYQISREEADLFAMDSQGKAIKAIRSGRFKNEIVPVSIKQRKGSPNWWNSSATQHRSNRANSAPALTFRYVPMMNSRRTIQIMPCSSPGITPKRLWKTKKNSALAAAHGSCMFRRSPSLIEIRRIERRR